MPIPTIGSYWKRETVYKVLDMVPVGTDSTITLVLVQPKRLFEGPGCGSNQFLHGSLCPFGYGHCCPNR